MKIRKVLLRISLLKCNAPKFVLTNTSDKYTIFRMENWIWRKCVLLKCHWTCTSLYNISCIISQIKLLFVDNLISYCDCRHNMMCDRKHNMMLQWVLFMNGNRLNICICVIKMSDIWSHPKAGGTHSTEMLVFTYHTAVWCVSLEPWYPPARLQYSIIAHNVPTKELYDYTAFQFCQESYIKDLQLRWGTQILFIFVHPVVLLYTVLYWSPS
jgi:hypothetical protein